MGKVYKCSSDEEFIKCQKIFFKLGYKWRDSKKEIQPSSTLLIQVTDDIMVHGSRYLEYDVIHFIDFIRNEKLKRINL